MARNDFEKRNLQKPIETRRCVDCTYCDRRAYHSGKWPCRNPEVHVGVPVPHDLPCFVRRGSKEAAQLHGEK